MTLAQRGKMQGEHPVHRQILHHVRMIDASHPHQHRLFIHLTVVHVGVKLILPNELITMTIEGEVRRCLPRMVTRFPKHIGRLRGPSIERGKDAQVDTQAGRKIWDVADTHVTLGVGAPAREAQIMGPL